MTATDHRTAPATGTAPVPVLLLDVVGLTPRALQDMPRLRALADAGQPGHPRHRAARGDLLGAVDLPHRVAAAPSTAPSATAGTSATSAR